VRHAQRAVTVEPRENPRPDDLNIVQLAQHGVGDTEIGGMWIVLSG
jgi:hypothetical protein